MRRSLLPVTLVAAACTTAPAPKPAAAPVPAPAVAAAPAPAAAPAVPASALVDHAGDSIETAVTVPADAANEGVDFENDWIWHRFGRFRRHEYGMGHAGDRRYDVITVELPDGSLHKVFFDITDMWSRWKPPAKP